ncbi:MAG TPA: HEAT repeat domain-containing protein [Vicinamibacterales bacterium]
MRAAVLAFACSTLLFAPQQPRVINGRLDQQAAGSSLDAAFKRLVAAQSDPAWIGYSVPIAQGRDRRLCCNGDTWISDGTVITNGRLNTCGLEPGDRATRTSQGQSLPNQGPIHLEGPDTMLVLFRVEEKQVQRIRLFSPDCELDAGGRTIHWLDTVDAASSITLLRTFVDGDRVRGSALAAIAMHTDDLSVPALIDFARHAALTKVRGDALFWLGQKAGEKAIGEITAAIDNDPETEVKKRAVFALSQLPKDEGVPLLIKVAKTNQNPAVRKQAMFWLGQSHDPRALDFFAEILGKK